MYRYLYFLPPKENVKSQGQLKTTIENSHYDFMKDRTETTSEAELRNFRDKIELSDLGFRWIIIFIIYILLNRTWSQVSEVTLKNTIQCNTTKNNTIQQNTIQYIKIQHNTTQYKTTQQV